MFICDQCKTVVGKKTSAVRIVLQTRDREYHNEFQRWDEEKDKYVEAETDSTGWETVKECKVCPDCAEPFGIPKRVVRPAERKGYTFEEKLPVPMRIPLVAVAVHNTLERLGHAEKENKRAKRDCTVSVPLIKGFVDNNKEYVF